MPYNGTPSNIEIANIQSNPDYVEFKYPPKVRVKKSSGEVEHFNVWEQKWVPMKSFINQGKKGLAKNLTPYYRISKYIPGKGTTTFAVYKLVALACVPNPDPVKLTKIMHIDGDSTNDKPDNLKWVEPIVQLWTHKRHSKMSMEERKELAKQVSGPHDMRNPSYAKFYNNFVGSDGMTHAQRFQNMFKDKGYKNCINPATGSYMWKEIATGLFFTTSELRTKFNMPKK